MGDTRNMPRRALLTRGALFVGGLFGLGLVSTSRGSDGSAVGLKVAEASGLGRGSPTGPVTMRLHGANWQLTYPDRPRGVLPHAGQRSAVFGELFGGPDVKVGEFYASSFQFGAPFGASEWAAGAMETHQFNFADGTIVGIGTLGDLHGSTSVHAIIGGTGRYEGASGSYSARQRPVELGGDGTADFEFNVILRSA